MKRFSHLMIASAVAAALAAPALAQQSSTTDPTRGTAPRDATGMPSGSPTQPGQHPRAIGDQGAPSGDRMSDPGRRGAHMSQPGAYGEDTVRRAQQALHNKGYDVGAVDGVMGPRTEAALRDFQQREGLGGSGQLDAQTLSALNVADSGATGANRRGTLSDRARSNRGAGASGVPGSDPGTTGGPAGAVGSGSGTAPGAAAGGTTGSSTVGTPGSSGGTGPNPSSAGRTTGMPSSDPGSAQPGGSVGRPGG